MICSRKTRSCAQPEQASSASSVPDRRRRRCTGLGVFDRIHRRFASRRARISAAARETAESIGLENFLNATRDIYEDMLQAQQSEIEQLRHSNWTLQRRNDRLVENQEIRLFREEMSRVCDKLAATPRDDHDDSLVERLQNLNECLACVNKILACKLDGSTTNVSDLKHDKRSLISEVTALRASCIEQESQLETSREREANLRQELESVLEREERLHREVRSLTRSNNRYRSSTINLRRIVQEKEADLEMAIEIVELITGQQRDDVDGERE